MKQSLQLKLSHQLRLTPQLQQAIRLLQLSSHELDQEVQQALETNPVLEQSDDVELNEINIDNNQADTLRINHEDDAELHLHEQNELPEEEHTEWSEQIPEVLSVDSSWDDIYEPLIPHDANERPFEINRNFHESAESALHDHLIWQLNLLPLSETDQLIALNIIDSINSDGYLSCNLTEIHQQLAKDHEIDESEVRAVLQMIQQLDPPGIGARDLRECLLLQLKHDNTNRPAVDIAIKIVDHHIDAFAKHQYKMLISALEINEVEFSAAAAIIRSLIPNPGAQISALKDNYVIPDVMVSKQNDHWVVELNPEVAPRLRLNKTYLAMLNTKLNSTEQSYLRNQVQEARWLIRCLKSRFDTIIAVATCIVEKQAAFLEYGEEAMRPLVMQQIAQELDMHESTISRATTNKYISTPRGVYELKFFFSSHVMNEEGEECSSVAIRAVIKKIVEEESATKPLSDDKIASLLKKQGIHVARRTVAKYREMLNIPTSSLRKQFKQTTL